MTLFFDGIPSSGGPRCLGWRGARGLDSLLIVGPVATESSWIFCVLTASVVVSVKGKMPSTAVPFAWAYQRILVPSNATIPWLGTKDVPYHLALHDRRGHGHGHDHDPMVVCDLLRH